MRQEEVTPLVPGQQALLKQGIVKVRDRIARGYRLAVQRFLFQATTIESLLNEIARWYDAEAYQNPT
ncbi:MAG: hypothetical protein ACLU4J_03175 [Butyricimonas paravirosa]